MGPEDWILMAPISLSGFVGVEIIKLIFRRMRKQTQPRNKLLPVSSLLWSFLMLCQCSVLLNWPEIVLCESSAAINVGWVELLSFSS
jgi:hypothetical protein